jgi:DNA-binding transcriptional ArsR family regulator
MEELKMDTDAIAKIFKALGHPTRVRILEHLLKMDSCFCGQIVDIFPFSQSTISQHLKLLKESGIINGNIEGPATCYCVDKTVLKKFRKYVSTLNTEG